MAKKKNTDKLHELVADIKTAMFTTRRSDGHLVSRPMATQKQASGADVWFVTDKSSSKVRELRNDSHVNVSYYNESSREWVSVSGTARLVTDRKKIRELYMPDWRAWFGDEGGAKDGTPDDPRMILIGVRALEAQYLELNKPRPVMLLEVMKGMVTGKSPDFPPTRKVKGMASREKRGARR